MTDTATVPDGITEADLSNGLGQALLDSRTETERVRADLIRARADVADLSARLDRVQETLRQSQSAHTSDLTIIGEALKETADRHEWCDTYDQSVSDVVARLSYMGQDTFREAAIRSQEYVVRFSGSVTITASSADAAAEEFSSDPTSYIDTYGLSVDEVEADY